MYFHNNINIIHQSYLYWRMSIIKKTYSLITNTKTNRIDNVCSKCNRSEKDLTGENQNTNKSKKILCPENLCLYCEINEFPERFCGCAFCKRPIREKFSCAICSNGFIDWMRDILSDLNNNTFIFRTAAKQLLNKTKTKTKTNDHNDNSYISEEHKFIVRTEDGLYKWP